MLVMSLFYLRTIFVVLAGPKINVFPRLGRIKHAVSYHLTRIEHAQQKRVRGHAKKRPLAKDGLSTTHQLKPTMEEKLRSTDAVPAGYLSKVSEVGKHLN